MTNPAIEQEPEVEMPPLMKLKQLGERIAANFVSLEEENERLTDVVENVPVALMVIDAAGIITLANSECEKLLGVQADGLTNVPIASVLEDPKALDGALKWLESGLLLQSLPVNFQAASRVELMLSASPKMDSTGNLEYIRCMLSKNVIPTPN